MKKYLSIIFLGALVFTSCKKWLEVTPKTEVKANILFSNQAGFRDALIGIYSLMTMPDSYGTELTMATVEVLGQSYDNVRSTAGHNYEFTAKYEYDNAVVESRFANIWRQQYKGIVNANLILENIDAKKEVFAAGNYQLVKGEALALRALLHFDLLRLFSPSIVAGAGENAIPYVASYTNVPMSQATVAATLDKVIGDLLAARALLKDVDPYGPNGASIPQDDENDLTANRQHRLNYYAVTGLLARAYLYKGDRPNALTAAQEVIASPLFPMFALTGGGAPVQPADYMFPTEQLFCLEVEGLKEKYAEGLFPEVTFSNNANALTVNNSSLLQLFPADVNADYRNNWFDVATSNSKRITKYNFNTIIPVVKKSEMLLIAAECEPEVPLAINGYLNILRAHRGLAGLDPGIDRAGLEAEIALEYRREFIAEGQLFYYYKRLNVDKLPPIPQFPDPAAVYALPIPTAEIEFGNIE